MEQFQDVDPEAVFGAFRQETIPPRNALHTFLQEEAPNVGMLIPEFMSLSMHTTPSCLGC